MNRKALYILLALLLFFLSIELALRVVEKKLSKDLVHYDQMNAIIHELKQPSENNILFLGNSLTREGIEEDILHQYISDAKIEKIYPDDTTITEWYWIFFKRLVRIKPDLDMIIIPFAPGHLSDQELTVKNITRLSKLLPVSDLLQVRKYESLGIDNSSKLLLSHISVFYASRERIQKRLLDLLPYYRDTIQEINRSMKKESKAKQGISYHHLHDLMQQKTFPKLQLIFVAVPLIKKYTIEAELLQLFEQYENVHFLDGNAMKDIEEEDFSDGYHLNEVGAKKFSHFIGNELTKINNIASY